MTDVTTSVTATAIDGAIDGAADGDVVEVLSVRSGEAVLHVECRGPDTGPLVVLVHGYPDDLRTWDLVAERLAEDHRVVAFDLRGMGRSRVPEGPASHTMVALCNDIDAVVAAVAGTDAAPFHLVGHDWGSIIGWAYVADPARAHRVRSWTSLSAPHPGVGAEFVRGRSRAARRQALRSSYVAGFQVRGLAEAVWRRRAQPLLRRVLTESGVSAGDPLLDRRRDEILAFALPGLELYRQNLHPRRLPPAPPPGSVTVPTLLVVATEDRYVTAPLARASLPLCTDVSVLELPAGHWVIRSHVDEVAAAIAGRVRGEPVGARPTPIAPAHGRRRRGRGRPRPGLADAGTPGALRERVVLVTGAGGGIGRATAVDAAAGGAQLVLVDRDPDGVERTAVLCRAVGGAAETHVVDVTDREAMAAMAEVVLARHGAPDVLVNNAGVGMAGPFTAMELDDWDWIRSINLDAVVVGCHLFVPAMAARGSGHVVNVASLAGLVPARNMTAYDATKFAVVGFTEALAADLWSQGVAATAVCPGIVHTGIIGGTRFVGDVEPEQTRDRLDRLYRRRGFGPDKVAAAVWDAVARRHGGVLPVGPESRALHRLRRFAPRLSGVLGRSDALS